MFNDLFDKIDRNAPEFSRFYRSRMLRATRKEKRDKFTLRPSKFPVCSIRMFLNLLREDQLGYAEEEVTLFSDFFTGVGTTVHTVLQKWATISSVGVDRIYANWKCTNEKCGHINKRLSTYNKETKTCKKCGSPTEYHEVEVFFLGFRGHVDCLFRLENGKFIVVDFKTTTAKKITSGKLAASLQYRLQILTYAYILRTKSHLPITGTSLFYIARDVPSIFKEIPVSVNTSSLRSTETRVRAQVSMLKASKKALATMDITEVINLKPCHSHEQYEIEMYNEHDECPFVGICFNRDSLISTLDSVVSSEYGSEIEVDIDSLDKDLFISGPASTKPARRTRSAAPPSSRRPRAPVRTQRSGPGQLEL